MLACRLESAVASVLPPLLLNLDIAILQLYNERTQKEIVTFPHEESFEPTTTIPLGTVVKINLINLLLVISQLRSFAAWRVRE